jgi:hypothetical protein
MTDVNNQAMTFDDIDMEGIVAAPAYDTPPSGSYICAVSMQQKMIGNDTPKRCVIADCELLDTLEVGTQHTEKPHAAGQKFGIMKFVDTPEKVAYMKRDFAPFLEAVGTQSVNTMVASVQNLRCKVVVSYNRDDYVNATFEVIS